MSKEKLPKQYLQIKKRYAKYFKAVEELGKVVKQEGPLDERTAHLIQLAGAATVHSEGAVHSHVRRAMEAGVTPEEIYHAIILLTSTIGFPTVVAALSWAEDVIKNKGKKVRT
ncbi:MAG: alkylhydroperoxidase [Planctomycetes bacterium RIFCSPLOWO2_12_38_17]|nr:MAG: alkylhydroperoxidase [Planctomycetes bacterium RIFCSPLOWO2_12_38_17]